jgi:DNA-binding SARP family transcriptional activator
MEEWQQAVKQLSNGHYDQFEQLLQAQQEAAQRSGQLAVAAFLVAASQICLTCQQLQFERELHQRALEDASRREHELRKQLVTIVDMLSLNGPMDAGVLDDMTAASTVPAPLVGDQLEPETDKPKSLLQVIQQHLEPAPSLPATHRSNLMRSDSEEQHEESVPLPTIKGDVLERGSKDVPETQETSRAPVVFPGHPEDPDLPSPSLTVYCFGQFQAYLDDQPVDPWPSGKGKSIFKYLVTNRKRSIAKEVLMDLFWPEANPSAARNNLNVAIYALRQTLRKVNPDFSHVLFQGGHYQLNPELTVWVDAEEFLEQYRIAQEYEKGGDMVSAIHSYSTAETLYLEEFFQEDRYEEWIIPIRREFQVKYLAVLTRLNNYYFERQDYGACIATCNKMLAVDSCLEDAHRLVMRCYSREGQYHLALRQYHQCVSMLEQELEVAPSPQTTQIFEKIRRHDPV